VNYKIKVVPAVKHKSLNMYGGTFLPLILDGGEWLTLWYGEDVCCNCWVGGWVGSRACLNTVTKEKSLSQPRIEHWSFIL